MGDSQIHEALSPISWLSGKWFSDCGKGTYPTIDDFSYEDEVEFQCIGQPMFNFISTSRKPEKNTPMHQERGFLRIKPGTNQLDFIVSHNFGMTSIEEGTYDSTNNEITLESSFISRVSYAKNPHVTKIKRIIKLVDPDTLMITVFLETSNNPLSEHLKTIYKRV